MARRLNVPAFGIAVGAVWGVCALLMAWASWPTGGKLFGPAIELLHSMYPGYHAGFFGGILGLIWGFIDGLILAFAVAWLYNRLGTPLEEKAVEQWTVSEDELLDDE